MKLNKTFIKNRKILLFACLIISGLFFNLHAANAIGLSIPFIGEIYDTEKALNAVSFIDDNILKLLVLLAWLTGLSAFFLSFSALFLDWASSQPIILNNPLVNGGWNYAVGLVNMVFILILVATAFAFIFNKESFNLKKSLPKIIGVALLVNFSLLFVKIFVDIGWIIQNSLVSTFFGEGKLAWSVMWPLKLKLVEIFTKLTGQILLYTSISVAPGGDWWALIKLVKMATVVLGEAFMGSLSQTILLILFAFIGGLIFFIYGLLFLFRIVIIWLVAIAAPLAFVAFAFPATQKYFQQWLKYLTQWVFLGIIMFFLMGLGLKLYAAVAPAAVFNIGFAKSGTTLLSGYSQFIFLLVYLVATLAAVKKFMPSGMNAVWSLAEKGIKTTTGLATIQAIKGGLRLGRTVAPRVEKFGEGLRKRGETGEGAGLGRWAQRGLGKRISTTAKGVGEITKEQQEKEIASQLKELEKLTPTQLAGRIKEAIGPQTKAAAMAALYQKDAKKFQEQLDAKLFSEEDIVTTGKFLWNANQKDLASTHPSEAMVKAIFPKEWEAVQIEKAKAPEKLRMADAKYKEYQNLANQASRTTDDRLKSRLLEQSDQAFNESKRLKNSAEDGKTNEIELIQSIAGRLKPNQWAQMPDQYFKDPLTQQVFAKSATSAILSEIGREKGQNMIDVVQETFDKIGFEPLAKINPRAALWLLSNAAQEQSGFRPPSDVKYTKDHDRDYYKQIAKGIRQEAAQNRQELKGLIRNEFAGREQMMFRDYHKPETTTERRLLIKELTEEMGKKLPTKEEMTRKIGSVEDAYNKAAKEAEKARGDLRVGTINQQRADDIIKRTEINMRNSETAQAKRLKEMWEKK